MSAGNLYRYFPSKEAIVEGLCALDQQERARHFRRARRGRERDRGVRGGLARACRSRKPREKARLIVEIWAEAARNPRDRRDVARRSTPTCSARSRSSSRSRRQRGEASPRSISALAARVHVHLCRRSLQAAGDRARFRREAETAMALGVLKALCAGALAPLGRERRGSLMMRRALGAHRGRRRRSRSAAGAMRRTSLARPAQKLRGARPAGSAPPTARRPRRRGRAPRDAAAARGHASRRPSGANSSTGCSSPARSSRARRRRSPPGSTGFRSSSSTPRTATG